YECLAGTRPFAGDNLGQVLKRLVGRQYVPLRQAAPDVPEDVAALVDGMLAFDRAARPSDLRGAHAVLGRYVQADGDRAPSFDLPRTGDLPSPSVSVSASAPAARRRAIASWVPWLAGAAAVLVGVAGARGIA